MLVAEDNKFTIQQYQNILEKNGCEVTLAYDGEQCIQKFNEASVTSSSEFSPFDVVLIDNNMPKKTGAEATKEILEKCPKQRVIFASAYDISSILSAPGFLKNRVEILHKPFSLNAMVAKIKASHM